MSRSYKDIQHWKDDNDKMNLPCGKVGKAINAKVEQQKSDKTQKRLRNTVKS